MDKKLYREYYDTLQARHYLSMITPEYHFYPKSEWRETTKMDDKNITCREKAIQVKDFIIKNYPKSHVAEYDSTNENKSDETIFNECLGFFWGSSLGFCSCGWTEPVKVEIYKYLALLRWKDKAFDVDNKELWDSPDRDRVWSKVEEEEEKLFEKFFNCKSIYDNALVAMLAYVMDSAGFTEHGVTVAAAWLTEKGAMVLKTLELDPNIDDEVEKIEKELNKCFTRIPRVGL